MSSQKTGNLDNISDILIVKKITEKNLPNKPFDENFSDSAKENEGELLVEEHEAIVRKQLQMLQADERGKQALISEIAAIKLKQEKRAEAVKSRQHALEIEKERAKRIASLPPPLPKSVKLLLQKSDESKQVKPDVQMPEELKTVAITPVLFCKDENKENIIIDPVEMEAKKRMQEEWSLKAKKRFNEALKKDRQKEEYANVMKQIQIAEIENRREMSKNISSEKSKNVPCPISDKFQATRKQIDMENTAEKWFKKNTKEHVIEEIEGYQDFYETKYKRIDSEFESKMIDCVPSFVKENYEYLLEDESVFQGGKNFSGLDDSGSDLLNQAYIETPPHDGDGGGKIDLVIDDLDKLRSKLQTEYDQTLKPLLLASIEVSPKILSDKAVDTDFLKQPHEDKAVETDKPIENNLTPPSMSNFHRPGIFMYKKRYEQFLPSFGQYTVPDMHHRDVHFPLPALSEGLGATSWSSSSYCSLPSKHGFPNIPGSSEYCDICTAERENKFIEDAQPSEVPSSNSALYNEMRIDSSTNKSVTAAENSSPKDKIVLSGYVQQLAKKYFEPKSGSLEDCKRPSEDILATEHSTPEEVSPAFEKNKISEPFVGSSQIVSNKSIKVSPVPEMVDKSELALQSSDKIVDTFPGVSDEKDGFVVNKKSKKYEVSQCTFGEKLDAFKTEGAKSHESSDDYSDYDAEIKRLQMIQQVLSRRMLNFNSSSKTINQGKAEQSDQASLSVVDGRREMLCRPHVYHELSTIHEADSALTASSLQLSQSKLSFEKSFVKVKEDKSVEICKDKLEDSTKKLKMVSLLDPPDSKVSELAKNIHFVAETPEEAAKPFKVSKSLSAKSSDAAVLSTENVTPSHKSMSSSSSSLSNGKIYSSSLTENHAKHPHLKSTEMLPKYFEDISIIKSKNISSSESSSQSLVQPSVTLSRWWYSPYSTSSPSVPSLINTEIKANGFESSTNLPLVSGFIINRKTPSTSNFDRSLGSSSNLPLVSGFICDMKSPDSFHPMTPHSDISSTDFKSSITEMSKYNKDNNKIAPSVKEESIRYEHASSAESDIFKPMTPHSDISSPNVVTHSKQQIYAGISTESFQPMSPKSMISSPSMSSGNSTFKEGNALTEGSKFVPMTFRLTIPVPQPISSAEASVQKPKIKRMPEFQSCSKDQVHKQSGHMDKTKKPETEAKSPHISSNEGNTYLDRQSTYQDQGRNVSVEARSKQLSRACSSDFFVPQIRTDDVFSPQTQNQDFDLVEGSLTKSSQQENLLQSELYSQPSKTSSSSSGQTDDKFSKQKFSNVGSDSSCETKWKGKLREFTERRLADCRKERDILHSELSRGDLKKQYACLQSISSTCSSSENLSDMFSGSKIVFQSTPIKSMEELAQERGILEEPDLTLMATQSTCLPDVSELLREPSCSPAYCASVNLNLNKDITLLTSPSECKTPTNQSSMPSVSGDTPSMLSFLQHEMSCMQAESSPDKNENSAPKASRIQSEVIKNQKFPRVEYKKRTKRLWNNLEEVKKRNLAEERKKLSSVNRLKAKEYAKKFTPKKKAN